MASTFLELRHEIEALDFWVAVNVSYSHPNKHLGAMDTIEFQSGQRVWRSPLVLDREVDSLIDTTQGRHIRVNRNLSGLVFDEIVKTDLQLLWSSLARPSCSWSFAPSSQR